MSTIRDRPKGLAPAPLKPRLAANISNPKSTPPPRLTVRSQDSPASPASAAPPRRPLVATTTANARQSPATPTTTAAASKNANISTPTNRPLLRAARPTSTQSPPTPASTNSRSTTPITTARTSNTTNRTLREAPSNRTLREAPSSRTLRGAASSRTLRKAPSTYFSPSETRSRAASSVRPPLVQKTSSFVYANGEAGEEIIKNPRGSDAQSVRSRSPVCIFANSTQQENVQSARSSVASSVAPPSTIPLVAQPIAQLLTPVSVKAMAGGSKSIASRLDELATPDNRPTTPAINTSPNLEQTESIQQLSTALNNLERAASPADSDISTGIPDSNPHVTRTKISVDFPSKLPSPARRRSIAVERKTSLNSTFSPGHRKIQSVSAATPPPPRLSRIDTGIIASPISESVVDSPLPSRLPRRSIDAGTATTISAEQEGGEPSQSPEETESEAPAAHVKIGAARHERKLLDLEISNSSLLAINRSLEREVLKQKSELRRLRRATRGGMVNNRTSWLSEMSMGEDASSDMGMSSPADSETMEQSRIDEFDTPTKSYGLPTQPSNDKRTNLDLSKHKDLLIDSQKMNLSLQRCLGMTEQLLKDASKALAYQPKVTSKVVSPEERSVQAGHTLSPSTEDDYFTKNWDWTNVSNGYKMTPRRSPDGRETSMTDKDSGVELDDTAHDHVSKAVSPNVEVDGELAYA